MSGMLTGKEKAWVAAGVQVASAVVAVLLVLIPGNETVEVVATSVSGVLFAIGSGLGVWRVRNTKVKRPIPPLSDGV